MRGLDCEQPLFQPKPSNYLLFKHTFSQSTTNIYDIVRMLYFYNSEFHIQILSPYSRP
jgi:hypothetical protein